jgi:pyruvate formate lyase activating enzyme
MLERTRCIGCGSCVQPCSAEALGIWGEKIGAERILEVIEQDMDYFADSGGGVTFSGGEPLLQVNFVESLLYALKLQKIHTAIETCGNVPLEFLSRIQNAADLIFFDVKHWNSDIHKKLTGEGNERILSNLRWLSSQKLNFVVRLPIIPGCNNSDEDVEETCKLLNGYAIRYAELLFYHRLGTGKYADLGVIYPLQELMPFSSEEENKIRSRFAHAFQGTLL